MDLERRIERLERENRRLKLIGSVVVAILAVAALAGAVAPQEVAEEIEARMFRIVDDDGDPLVELSAYSSGSRLVMVDQSGRWRVVLGALESGPQIALHDHDNDDMLWRALR